MGGGTRRFGSAFAVLGPLMLGGCIPFPTLDTISPTAEVTVVDETGAPVEGALVELTSHQFPGFSEDRVKLETTNRSGHVYFEPQREVHMSSLMPHGMRFFQFSWCISKPGFETITMYDPELGNWFELARSFRLKRGAGRSCGDPAK